MVSEEDRPLQERQRTELPHQVRRIKLHVDLDRCCDFVFSVTLKGRFSDFFLFSHSCSFCICLVLCISAGRMALLCVPSSTDTDQTLSTTLNSERCFSVSLLSLIFHTHLVSILFLCSCFLASIFQER